MAVELETGVPFVMFYEAMLNPGDQQWFTIDYEYY